MANILLAGGDEEARRKLGAMLACYGHRVRPQESARSAASAHRHQPAELLILDVCAGADVDAVGAFRREDDDLPILALTAGAASPSLVAALDAGADAALTISAPKLTLLNTVDRLLACFPAEPPEDVRLAA